jgi:hypothetical protein
LNWELPSLPSRCAADGRFDGLTDGQSILPPV